MNVLDILKQAIHNRQQISFEYNREGKVEGKRIGDPYAIFIFTAKNTRIQSTKVHIVQTSGVSDSAEVKPFPSFRMYNIEELSRIQVLEELPKFTPPFHEAYNPEWEGYKDVIAKV